MTTKSLKDNFYNNNHNVITFEKMLTELSDHFSFWENYNFSKEEIDEKINRYERLIDENNDKNFVEDYYRNTIDYIQEKYN